MKKENRTPEEIKVDNLKKELLPGNLIWAKGRLARTLDNVLDNKGQEPTVNVKYLEVSHDMEDVALKDCDPIIASKDLILHLGFRAFKDIPEHVKKLYETEEGRVLLHKLEIGIQGLYQEEVYFIPSKGIRFDFIRKSNGVFCLVLPNDKAFFGEEHRQVSWHLLQNYFKFSFKEDLDIPRVFLPPYEPYIDLK